MRCGVRAGPIGWLCEPENDAVDSEVVLVTAGIGDAPTTSGGLRFSGELTACPRGGAIRAWQIETAPEVCFGGRFV